MSFYGPVAPNLDLQIKFSAVRVSWPDLSRALDSAGYVVDAGNQTASRLAYDGELTAFMRRFKPDTLANASDEEIARRFMDYVKGRVAQNKSTLALPQLRHIANRVAKLRNTSAAAG